MALRYTLTRIHLGQRMQFGETEVTPYARATVVQFPGLLGGLVWNRPAGVLVKWSDGSEARLLIRDVTRRAQISLLLLGFLGGLAAWVFHSRRD
ncbi:MAG: hypothetical protein IH858_09705 [Chloroflexi bacterium]|nr:hypothetical protein [Chloroflexota bacterium]